MFFRLFKTYRIYTIGLIIIMACVIWLSHIQNGSASLSMSHTDLPIFVAIVNLLGNTHYLPGITMLILSILIALYLTRLNTHNNFISERSYLPAFFFIVLAGSISSPALLNAASFSLLFVLFATDRIIQSFKTDSMSYKFFDASIFIGIASLFYFPSIFYIVMLLCILATMRPFFWREWLYAVLGMLFVYFVLWSVHYLYNLPIENYISRISSCFQRPYEHVLKPMQYVLYGLMALLILFASLRMIQVFPSIKIFARKVFRLWLAFFIFSCLLLFIPCVRDEVVIFIAVPLCYLFTHYFISLRTKWFGEVIFFLILGILFCIHFL
jgi:hypothetical protein